MVSITDLGAIGDGDASHAAANRQAIQTALDNASIVEVPAGTYVIDATLNVPANVTIAGEGYTASCIKLSNAAPDGTDILHLDQWVTLRDLWISGNWDGSMTGQSGVGIHARNPSGSMHGLTFTNLQVDRCKSNGFYVYEAAYMRWNNVLANTFGLNGCVLEGASPGSFTSSEIGGRSRFSDCPNGYALRLKNCHSSRFSIISEHSKGIAFEGENRALTFDSCYFESDSEAVIPHVFNVLSGGMIGLTISNSFFGMIVSETVVQDDPNFLACVLLNNFNASTKRYLGSLGGNRWTVIEGGLVRRGTQAVLATHQQTVSNTGSGESQLWSFAIPADTLTTDGQQLRLRIWGKTNDNANGKNLRLYLGNTVVFESGPVAADNRDWAIDLTLLRDSATTARTVAEGVYNAAPVVNCATISAGFGASLELKATGQGGATGDLLLQGASLKLVGRELQAF
ncbi:glycosyl hydrolase family 28-related protein [Sphingomonas sp. Root241]|uniref:glycosyl hydrolase family 28-related protein n=1 Tax=Sphingomonas sp. Root241 TaxID=1736501 RepID=UPI0007159AC6|nr:glycosyl hydrolase family 28-related protein [Sphingomonas sp. Root241]KRC82396.1 hypothetical protein ASE13_08920 [Sphingomonas sp. Root241]